MILQKTKIKSFFLNKNLEIPFLILFISFLFSFLPTSVHAAAGANAYQNGDGAAATGDESISIGQDSLADADNAISIGYLAGVPAGSPLAPVGQSAISIGGASHARGAFSIAIGPDTFSHLVHTNGNYGTALGAGSRASGTYSTALGYNAYADHTGSVAIGTLSQPTHEYTITVGSGLEGSPHANRRITHVADPIEPRDAATKAYADTHRPNFSDKISTIKERIKTVGAMQMSVLNAQVDLSDNNRTAVGIGMGAYQGATAATVGVVHRMPGRFSGLQLSGNFTIATEGDKAGGAGIGYAF